jgi:cyclopropane fatty-acyl-phospholipid synthase-like methyltransferase
MSNKQIHDYYEKLAAKIQSPIETRNKAKDFSEFDIKFVLRYASAAKTLLDLGAGTGLLVNHLVGKFKHIHAVEKYESFSKFITRDPSVTVTDEDVLTFDTEHGYDIVAAFGLLNFFSEEEAKLLFRKIYKFSVPNGMAIVKHQMGVNETVVVNGYSEELQQPYYSEYRHVAREKELLLEAGFSHVEVIDIYPAEYNRWPNTHFYALVGTKA